MMNDESRVVTLKSGGGSSAHHSSFRVQHSEGAVLPVYAREDILAARFRVAKDFDDRWQLTVYHTQWMPSLSADKRAAHK